MNSKAKTEMQNIKEHEHQENMITSKDHNNLPLITVQPNQENNTQTKGDI